MMRPIKVFAVCVCFKSDQALVYYSVYGEEQFYSVDLGLNANSGFGRKFRSSFILWTPYSYCNVVNSIAAKSLFQYFYLGEPNAQPTKAYLRSLHVPNETVSWPDSKVSTVP